MRKTPKRRTRTTKSSVYDVARKQLAALERDIRQVAQPPTIEELVQLHASLAEFNKHLQGENMRLVEAVKAAEEKPRQDLLAIVSEATAVLVRTTKIMTETCNALAAKERTLDEVLKETRERLTKVVLEVEARVS